MDGSAALGGWGAALQRRKHASAAAGAPLHTARCPRLQPAGGQPPGANIPFPPSPPPSALTRVVHGLANPPLLVGADRGVGDGVEGGVWCRAGWQGRKKGRQPRGMLRASTRAAAWCAAAAARHTQAQTSKCGCSQPCPGAARRRRPAAPPQARAPAMYLACAWMPYSHMRIVLSSAGRAGARGAAAGWAAAGGARRPAALPLGCCQQAPLSAPCTETPHLLTPPSPQPHPRPSSRTRGGHEAAVAVDEGHGVDGGQVVVVDL